jgi:deazaflavin-dependent oxidoreductase (nitroreductase family)
MEPRHYGPLHALVQRLAASAWGSWLLARVLRGADRLTLRLSGGRTTLTSLLTGVPVMWVTSTGAHSGQPRTRPLLPIRDDGRPGRFALIASNFGQHHFPAWYYNLKKNPRATCLVDGRPAQFRAHEAAGEEYERFWRYATNTYFGYSLYRKRAGRRIPIIVLEQDDQDGENH